MVFVVAPEEESGVKELLAAQGETVYCIGEVQSRNGDEPQVEILGLDTWASAPSAAAPSTSLPSESFMELDWKNPHYQQNLHS